MKNIFASSLSCALATGREKSFFAYMFSLEGTGSYSVWSQCSHYIETICLICITNQLTRGPVSRAFAWSLAQNDYKLKMVIGSKNWPTVKQN